MAQARKITRFANYKDSESWAASRTVESIIENDPGFFTAPYFRNREVKDIRIRYLDCEWHIELRLGPIGFPWTDCDELLGPYTSILQVLRELHRLAIRDKSDEYVKPVKRGRPKLREPLNPAVASKLQSIQRKKENRRVTKV